VKHYFDSIIVHMSVDLYLYNKSRKPVPKSDVESKLSELFVIQDVLTEGNTNETLMFKVKVKENKYGSDDEGYDFSFQKESGQYWAYTYNYEGTIWNEFVYTVSEVSKALDLLIEDPQSDKKDIDPMKFMLEQTQN
jgi:hypothetical protein